MNICKNRAEKDRVFFGPFHTPHAPLPHLQGRRGPSRSSGGGGPRGGEQRQGGLPGLRGRPDADADPEDKAPCAVVMTRGEEEGEEWYS